MIASWMLHATLVSLLLALAARAAEAALSAYRLPVRWAWAGAAFGALALPAATAVDLTGRLASLLSSTAAAGGGAILTAAGDVPAAAPPVAPAGSFTLPALPTFLEPVAVTVWAAASLALAGWSLRAWLRFRRRRGGWERTRVDGVEVLVSETTGPAAIGVLKPVLVLPRWVLELPAAERRMVLRHEREHRDARDSLLLGFGLAALVAAPWNAALWWIASRLRLAVELDCDRRVLADGASPGEYGALLLEITRGRRVQPLAAALGHRRSRLETRIRAMTDAIPRFRPARTAFLALAGAGLLAAACDAPTPSEQPTEPDASASAAADRDAATIPGGDSLATADGSPLVFVDGERIETEGGLRDLDPKDIESIEVLKGPTAVELYGEEGRDGVIRITTKTAAATGG